MNTKKIFALSLFVAGLILIFTGVFYFVNRHIENSYDIRLRNTINNASVMIPSAFADSAANDSHINQLAYDSVRNHLNKIARINEVAYVYAVIQKEGHYYFIISNYTEEDVKNNMVSDYLSEYSGAPEGLTKAFSSSPDNSVFDDYHDMWGGFHSLFVTQKSSNGTKYVIGADFKLRDLMNLKWITTLVIIGVIVALGFLIFPLAFAFAKHR